MLRVTDTTDGRAACNSAIQRDSFAKNLESGWQPVMSLLLGSRMLPLHHAVLGVQFTCSVSYRPYSHTPGSPPADDDDSLNHNNENIKILIYVHQILKNSLKINLKYKKMFHSTVGRRLITDHLRWDGTGP